MISINFVLCFYGINTGMCKYKLERNIISLVSKECIWYMCMRRKDREKGVSLEERRRE